MQAVVNEDALGTNMQLKAELNRVKLQLAAMDGQTPAIDAALATSLAFDDQPNTAVAHAAQACSSHPVLLPCPLRLVQCCQEGLEDQDISTQCFCVPDAVRFITVYQSSHLWKFERCSCLSSLCWQRRSDHDKLVRLDTGETNSASAKLSARLRQAQGQGNKAGAAAAHSQACLMTPRLETQAVHCCRMHSLAWLGLDGRQTRR